MEEEKEAVTEVDNSATTTESGVNESQELNIPESSPEQVNKENSINPEQGQAHEQDRPSHKYEAEWQRKYNDLVDNLPRLIEEKLNVVKQPQVNTPREYTIQELEQIALQDPSLRPQVEAEKEKVRQKDILRVLEERDGKIQRQREADNIRMRSEQYVMNDPGFKECFITDALGNKQWNLEHPMTRMIDQAMRDPRLKDAPDALRIAADIAFGQYAREQSFKNQSKTKVLTATLKKEQKKTMVEGGVSNSNSGNTDSFYKAKQELAKTGTRKAAENAVSEYLRKAGYLR